MTTKSRKKPPRPIRKLTVLSTDDAEGFGIWMRRHTEWLRVRNYSEATVEKGETWLVAFAEWCAARGIMRPREVTKPILEGYRRYLFHYRKANGRPLAFAGQRARLAPLKRFFAWMTRQNAILWNPASELDMPRPEKRLPCALTAEEAEKVLATPALDDPCGLRDRAILEVFYSTGMRRSELAALRLSDIARGDAGGTVFIRQGKGKRDRIVPIGARALRWVDRYLAEVRPGYVVNEAVDTLFLSETGTAITVDTLSNRVARYVTAADIERRGSCHLFRHTVATLMLEAGADVRIIQELLGHASLESTEIYTRVSIRHLAAVHAATHPAERGPGVAATTPATASAESTGDEAEGLLTALVAEERDELAAG
jgi:integrase/recombinase XerD